jgi:hypothetical protein
MLATSPPFVVYALPRSRSFWLSRFLSASGWTCGHDEARRVRSLKDVRSWLSLPLYGTVETAGAPFWRLVQELRPDTRTVVLRRPVDQVIDSFIRTGLSFDVPRLQREIQRLDAKLDQIAARVPGALSVTFDELADEANCARVFEHCLSLPHDSDWYARAAPLNLQINLAALMRYYAANVGELQAAARSAGLHMRAKLMARPVTSAEFTFAQEPLSVLLRDGAALISERLGKVGESPGAIAMGNIPLLQKLEDLEMLHITTARQNGRVFGYSMAITAPSLQSCDRTESLHTSFFISPNAPGLGLKLQRASIEHLREQGVDDVFFQTGSRGSGRKAGSLCQKLGMEDAGQMFKLNLKVVH